MSLPIWGHHRDGKRPCRGFVARRGELRGRHKRWLPAAPARTCAPLTYPLPFTVIANAPAGTDGGAMPVSTGAGFWA